MLTLWDSLKKLAEVGEGPEARVVCHVMDPGHWVI